jgi:gliding motility-associated-like protein
MKKLIIFLMFVCTIPSAFADHITGGEMYYKLLSVSGGECKYAVTIKMYMLCSSERQFNDPTTVAIFNRGTGERITNVLVGLSDIQVLNLTNPNKCVTNPPTVCYRVGFYNFEVTLPVSEEGYVITAQIVFRINGIKNLIPNYGNIGATYTAEVPGTDNGTGAAANNSARFTGNDLVIICANNSFSYNFGAEDADGDQLRYALCNAYQGGSSGFGNNSPPPPPPPYESVPYGTGFSGSNPLGISVTIDPNTGVIHGLAPGSGIYAVTVCVTEFRNGKAIATQRKDLQINIASCTIAAASLRPEYMLCRDSMNLRLQNLSTSPLIKTYQWQIFDAEGSSFYNSTESSLSYTFADTGSYKIRLVINKDDLCSDSSESIVRVYPGFKPDFDFSGICFGKPTNFKDRTKTVYGAVSRWEWDFPTQPEPPLIEQNPQFTFNNMGGNSARLIVYNSNGCIDTITKTIAIVDKPPLDLAFRDTLICVNDQLQLKANASGKFTWSTSNQIVANNSSTITVSPHFTTTYYADIDDNSCKNRDSVVVRVTDHVDLTTMPDTTICAGDAIVLNVQSNGLKYTWTPEVDLDDATLATPKASPAASTTYSVIARIGGCSASDAIVVKAVPYPFAFAGNDTLICFNTPAQLHGSTDGRTFVWEPTNGMRNSSSLNPVAAPTSTTAYILSAYDVNGCPKPGKDTIVVQVLPKIQAYAGGDTAVVIGQPLQLHASGGSFYKWFPSEGLSADDIPDPIARYNTSSIGLKYKVYISNEAGCLDSAFVSVKVFNSLPSVSVPNAFTPNGDGRNDLFRFITAGIQRVEYFQVYNRWGQLVYRANSEEDAWDGTLAGKPQPSGTFVWIVKAIDYTGSIFSKRGTVTLIR